MHLAEFGSLPRNDVSFRLPVNAKERIQIERDKILAGDGCSGSDAVFLQDLLAASGRMISGTLITRFSFVFIDLICCGRPYLLGWPTVLFRNFGEPGVNSVKDKPSSLLQDPAEGSREIVERELRRQHFEKASNDRREDGQAPGKTSRNDRKSAAFTPENFRNNPLSDVSVGPCECHTRTVANCIPPAD